MLNEPYLCACWANCWPRFPSWVRGCPDSGDFDESVESGLPSVPISSQLNLF